MRLSAAPVIATPPASTVDRMRKHAMQLHSREQAPKEGGQSSGASSPAKWAPTLTGFLQFLVDSREVYGVMEEQVERIPALSQLRDTGLERVEALNRDIEWLRHQAGPEALPVPEVSERAIAYTELLRSSEVEGSEPIYLCHLYNYYFAHTAGGIMIGRSVGKALGIDSSSLYFYQWPRGPVKELLADVKDRIDAMASDWSEAEQQACLDETARAFRFQGALLKSLSG